MTRRAQLATFVALALALALAAAAAGCGGRPARHASPARWPPALEATVMRGCMARAGPGVAPSDAARACRCGLAVTRRRLSLRRFLAIDRARGELPAALGHELARRCRPRR